MNSQELADRLSLKELVDRFSILVDKKDVHTQVQLFWENAVSETFVGDTAILKLKGRKEMAEAFEDFLKKFQTIYHLNGQKVLTVNSKTVKQNVPFERGSDNFGSLFIFNHKVYQKWVIYCKAIAGQDTLTPTLLSSTPCPISRFVSSRQLGSRKKKSSNKQFNEWMNKNLYHVLRSWYWVG